MTEERSPNMTQSIDNQSTPKNCLLHLLRIKLKDHDVRTNILTYSNPISSSVLNCKYKKGKCNKYVYFIETLKHSAVMEHCYFTMGVVKSM